MKNIAIFFTVIYLILECITAIQSSRIFFEAVTPERLIEIERLGYVTAGIGFGILLCSRLKGKLGAWAYAPLFVFIAYSSSNTIHAIIKHAPKHFTVEMNRIGVYYGIGLLNQPSPMWPAFAYGLSKGPTSIPQQHVDAFVKNNGITDLQSRQLLSSGIRGIGLFSKHWDRAHQKLDRQELGEQFSRLHRAVYEAHFVRGTRKPVPFVLIEVPWSASPIINESVNKRLSQRKNWTAHEAAWWELRRQFEFLPFTAPKLEVWLNTFNQSFTKTTLAEYLELSQEQKMPWSDQPAYGELYQKVCQQIAPFFFKNESPVLNIAQLRDVSVRDMYINELKYKELSPKLKALMFDYQRDNLNRLIKTNEAWDNPVRTGPGYGLSRLIWLTPAMTMLSWVLLCVNAWTLVSQQTTTIGMDFTQRLKVTALVLLSTYLMASLLLSSEIWQLHIQKLLILIGPFESNIRIV